MGIISWLILAGSVAGILVMFCSALFADEDKYPAYYGEGR